jgi:mannose-6-phosphate isomerase-like protein (cupin superfamily)
MLIKKSETRKKENSSTCTVWEHDHPSKNLSYATILVNGRYPEEKYASNQECEEIIFVISGEGKIHTEKGEFELNPEDSYYLEKGEKFYLEGNNLLIGVINSPSWTFEQYKEVD